MKFDLREKFSIRKFKSVGTQSALIGKFALLSGAAIALGTSNLQTVSADEITGTNPQPTIVAESPIITENPATNLVEAQPAATDESIEINNQTGTHVGEIVTPIESSELNEAVANADKEGLVTTELPVRTVENFEQADNHLEKQEIIIEDVTKAKDIADTRIDSAVNTAENAGVDVTVNENKTIFEGTATELINNLDKNAAIVENKLDTITKAQIQIDSTLAPAVKETANSGVKIKVEPGFKTEDAKAALEDLEKQLEDLSEGRKTQTEIKSNLDEIARIAARSKINITYAPVSTTRDLIEAVKIIKNELTKVETLESDVNAANTRLQTTAQAAEREGVKVNVNETPKELETNIKQDSDTQVQKIETAIKSQRESKQIIEDAKNLADAKDIKIVEAEERFVSAGEAVEAAKAYKLSVDNAIKAYETLLDAWQKEVDAVEKFNKDKHDEHLKLLAEHKLAHNEWKADDTEYQRLNAIYQNKLKEWEANPTTTTVSTVPVPEAVMNKYREDLAEFERLHAEWVKQPFEIKRTTIGPTDEEIARATAGAKEFEAKLAEYERLKAEYDRLKTTIGYSKEALGQALNLDNLETNAIITPLTRPANEVWSRANVDRLQGYVTRDVVKSNQFLHYTNLKTGDVLEFKYTNLQNATFAGDKITEVHYKVTVMNDGANGFTDLTILNDPTEGFIGWRDSNTGNWTTDRTEYKVEASYKTAKGDVVFSDDTPGVFTHASLNHNNFGLEYVKNPSGRFVEINGSSVVVTNEGLARSIGANDGTSIYGEEWDVSGHPEEYKGAILSVANPGKTYTVTFGQGDMPSDYIPSYWFRLNTETVTPLAKKPPTPPGYGIALTGRTVEERIEKPEPKAPVEPKPTIASTTVPNPKPVPPLPPGPEPKTPQDEAPDKKLPPQPPQQTVRIGKITVVTDYTEVRGKTTVTPQQIEVVTHDIDMVATVDKPTAKVASYKVQVKQTPTNTKEVLNSDNSDINNQLVAKDSTVIWPLSNSALIGGRDHTIDYIMTDHLPNGFELNLDETIKLTPDYKVDFDKAKNKLTFTATAATLYGFNGDLTKTVNVPVAKIVGKVLNDAATYENTFTTEITTAETVIKDNRGNIIETGPKTTYKVVSNKPRIFTPGNDYRTENGDVVVRYRRITDNAPISGNVVDVENGEIGSTYDTTDNKPTTISFENKLYKITTKVEGNEKGKVSPGSQFITYYYEEEKVNENEGAVVVHYKDEEGNTIKPNVVDTPVSPVGTDYDTTDNKPNKITTPAGIEYEITTKMEGNEKGKVTEGVTDVTYIYKRITPLPPTPTPNDSKIQPEKHIYNEDGQQIDGKTLLPNTVAKYTAIWDLNQYKGMKASREAIAKGFGYIDDLKDSTVSIDVQNIKLYTIDKQEIKGVKFIEVDSLDNLDENNKALVTNAKITPEGKFILFYAENPEEFYNTYAYNGNTIFIDMPVITGDYVGTFENKTYQIDFGNGYASNVVVNDIPKLEAIKDVLESIGSGKSLNGKDIQLGQKFPYLLNGPAISGNIVNGLQSYIVDEDFDEKYDEYNGEYYAFLDKDFKQKDGTVIPKGTEITKYTTQVVTRNDEGQIISAQIKMNEEFLATLDTTGEFDPSFYFIVTRIAYGENIENTVEFTINGYKIKSNTVKTNTPKPVPPVTPEDPAEPTSPVTPPTPDKPIVPTTPVTPPVATPNKPSTPVAATPANPGTPVKETPNTGADAVSLGLVAGLTTATSLLATAKRKRED